MTHTDEQMTTIQAWLDANWYGTARCPVGHDDAWSLGDNMSFVPGFVADEKGPRIAHELGFRFVVLTCDNCGYVAFLNAKTLGLGT
jgi:hypothetical protein